MTLFAGFFLFCTLQSKDQFDNRSTMPHRRYLIGKLLSGWTIVHPSNTDYILKSKLDQFQISNGWVNY